MLHFSYNKLFDVLSLASEVPPRDVKQYRDSWQRKKTRMTKEPMLSPTYVSLSDTPRRGRRGLLAQTILEEGDSDF